MECWWWCGFRFNNFASDNQEKSVNVFKKNHQCWFDSWCKTTSGLSLDFQKLQTRPCRNPDFARNGWWWCGFRLRFDIVQFQFQLFQIRPRTSKLSFKINYSKYIFHTGNQKEVKNYDLISCHCLHHLAGLFNKNCDLSLEKNPHFSHLNSDSRDVLW